MALMAEMRRAARCSVSPELKRIAEAVESMKKALPEMEGQLLAAMKASKDHLTLKIDFALLQQKYEDLQREHEGERKAQ